VSATQYKENITLTAGCRLVDGRRFTERDQFLDHIAFADVLIDETYNARTAQDFFDWTGLNGSSPYPFIQNTNVWRLDGLLSPAHSDDWFESSFLEPDVVLEDFLHAVFPGYQPWHRPTWFRAVLRDQPPRVVTSASCVSISQPLNVRADGCPDGERMNSGATSTWVPMTKGTALASFFSLVCYVLMFV